MGRQKKYTDDFYDEAARDATNRMGRKEKGYTKSEILEAAGFDGEQTQHWAKLRRAFTRCGIVLCYTDGKGWHKGMNGDDNSVIEMWHRQMKRLARAFRPDVVTIMQSSENAEIAVAHLAEKGLDPLTFLTACQHAGEPLPEAIEVSILEATAKMLPEMPVEMQQQIKALGSGFTRIAGLLPGSTL